PGPPERVRPDDHRPGDLQRPVRRVLRDLPRPDAAQREGRHATGIRGVAGRAAGGAVRGAIRRARRGGRPMTTSRAVITDVLTTHHVPEVGGLTGWLTTTDHKRIGVLYITSSFVFFLVGGLMAEAMRAELAAPGIQLVGEQGYDQLFTMHGT